MKNSWVTSWDLTKPTGQNPGRRSQLHWLDCGPQSHLFIIITWASNSSNGLKLWSRAKACWEISFIQWKRLSLRLRTKIFPRHNFEHAKSGNLWALSRPVMGRTDAICTFAHKKDEVYLNAAYNIFSVLRSQRLAIRCFLNYTIAFCIHSFINLSL